MQMDNGEIARSYKAAKDKSKQVKVLSELNCTSADEIKRILEEQGELKPVKRKYTRKAKDPEKPINTLTEIILSEDFSKRVFGMLDGIENDIKAEESRIDMYTDLLAECRDKKEQFEKTYKEAADFIKKLGIERA